MKDFFTLNLIRFDLYKLAFFIGAQTFCVDLVYTVHSFFTNFYLCHWLFFKLMDCYNFVTCDLL